MIFNQCFTDEQEWDLLADATLEALKAALEKTAKEGNNKHGIHFDSYGNELLCKTEKQAEGIADFLEDLGFSEVRTGYYDPKEDGEENINDEYTGMYYIDWD